MRKSISPFALKKRKEKNNVEADSCFNRVSVPTSHKTYEESANACSTSADDFGCKGMEDVSVAAQLKMPVTVTPSFGH